MRLLSLNIAQPKLIEYKGEKVSTGIFKVATDQPCRVRKLNIDGDGQADLTVHGGIDKAVYVFPSEHYSYFAQALGQGPYAPGQFGENLTTEGMLESKIRIGDRYRTGNVILEVSQPRSPCYKFAIKMGTAEALKVFINSGMTGFYTRVLKEGVIRAGDEIELEFTNKEAPTVEEVHHLYYFDKQNIETLTKAVRCDRLADAFKDEFEIRLKKLIAETGSSSNCLNGDS